MDLSEAILAMAQAEGPSSVLGKVLAPLAEKQDVLLACVWFLDDADCPACSGTRNAVHAGMLHLRASGASSVGAVEDAGGAAHLVPMEGPSRIAAIAARGEPVAAPVDGRISEWGLADTSPAASQIRGALGYPLVFRGRVVGVLACYLRTPPNVHLTTWLPSFIAHAAVAIGNCRALQEIKRLHEQLELERDYLREEAAGSAAVAGFVAHSDAMAPVLRQVGLVAPTDANVLVEGESGSGKELIARAIHERSPRAHRALVKVNCASVPKDLFESEFFGHVRGAFTGAVRDRIGRFQLADRGTLFLDEVGEIPLELQTKLLRVLQEGEFERVGEDATRHVDVRVVAATNRNLRAEVDAGRFRLDLFYRLSVFPVHVPPLRERRSDIPSLTRQFVKAAGQRLGRTLPRVPRQEMSKLLDYDWPGNVRELQHVVERAVILASQSGRLHFDITPGRDRASRAEPERPYRTHQEWKRLERANLLAALKESGGKVSGASGAAALLGMNPNTLTSRLRVLGLRRQFGD